MKVFRLFSLIFFLSSFASLSGHAQDILFKMDGEQIEVKVLEVSTTEVKYKLTSNLEGPTYVLPKSDIYMVEYANGSKEVYATKDKPKHGNDKEEVDTVKRSKEELRYKRQVGGGIAGVIIGPVALAISVPFLVVKSIDFKNAPDGEKEFGPVAGAGFGVLLGIVSLSAGIDALVKSSVTKSRLDNFPVTINPKLIDTASYDGMNVQHANGYGLSISYGF